MKKLLAVFTGAIFCFLLSSICQIHAEEENSSSVNWKEEISSDKQQIKEQRQEIKQDAQEARAEEEAIRQQIRDAMAAGNTKKAAQLKEQLKSFHQKNIQEMKQDKEGIREARKEVQQDKKEQWDSLTSEQREKMKERRKDLDNSPPGQKGGPGTNWENPPGPKGGPGASPDRGLHKGDNQGVRDHGKGIGQGKGQGPTQRNREVGPRGGGGHKK